MRRSVFGLVAVAAALTIPAPALGAAAIVNGSFEGSTPVGSFMTLPTNSALIDGWTVSAGSVDWIGTYWSAYDGARSVDMNGASPGALTQVVATTANVDYVVTFYLAGNPDCGSTTKTLTVGATGGAPGTYSFSTAGTSRTAMGWSAATYSFTATSDSTTLTIASTTPGACGPALDQVSLAETAPPVAATASDCKKGGWRTMTDDAGNPFKNQGDCVSYFASDGRNPAGQP
jgi:choice-of-anchor C domain-containing protein